MKRGVIVVGLLLMALCFMGFVGVAPGFTSREPIVIRGNADFTAENGVIGGSGTVDDPYIIAGWEIDAQGGSGISIEGTTAYFVIKNCRIKGAGPGPRPDYSGIRLVGVNNGAIEYSEILSNNGDGIYLDNSLNIKILGNLIYGNKDYGIVLNASRGVTIERNAIVANGHGIAVGLYRASSGNRILFNIIVGNGYHGLAFYGTPYADSSDNIVHNNHIVSNRFGIFGQRISYNTISGNLIRENSYGIWFYFSKDNRVYHNNLIDNGSNGRDDGVNRWDDGTRGNYWSDYGVKYPQAIPIGDVWDTPYEVPGGENADRYPLVNMVDLSL